MEVILRGRGDVKRGAVNDTVKDMQEAVERADASASGVGRQTSQPGRGGFPPIFSQIQVKGAKVSIENTAATLAQKLTFKSNFNLFDNDNEGGGGGSGGGDGGDTEDEAEA